ncbi:hypothetical protein KIN20_009460 [Parelaphostrongylus tenuis]|uniref:Uncharacterized protein n=1 Tax=Parelaphostrongylus tenuis TaxID=148309 RepID=A0AAD5QND7_PARTN|nr:hypothetical protein KIN20_009460 [Parelaphostrongylus tenuis]
MDKFTRRRIARQALRTNQRRQSQQQQPRRGPTRPVTSTPPPTPIGPPDWLLPIPVPPNARGQVAYHPYDCMTLSCLCPFFAVSCHLDFSLIAGWKDRVAAHFIVPEI